MRVILVGSPADRARLRAQIAATAIEVVAEYATLAEARERTASAGDRRDLAGEIDGILVAPDQNSGSQHRSGVGGARGSVVDNNRQLIRRHQREADTSDEPELMAGNSALTPREIQVVELLAEGLSNKSIAARLGISDQTVKFHVASISSKLGAANRTDAVRRAVRRGLITL